MTDKQIIIGDCIHLDEWKHCDICEKLIKTIDGANGKKREHLLTEEDLRCDFYPNCYYKQLARKEQECEKLKEAIDGLLKIQYQLADSCTKYEQTLTEIKEMLKEICMEECSFDWNKTSKKHCGDCDCRYGQILQKISECEVKNEN